MHNFDKNFKILVLGVGGAGSNIVSQYAFNEKNNQVQLVIVNTDLQDLNSRPDSLEKLQIGVKTTNGFGAGSNYKLAEKAIQESQEEVKKLIDQKQIVFVVCGLGKGTGSGAGPLIAKLAKESGALSIVLATTPYEHEGEKKKQTAHHALEMLKTHCDSYTIFSNEKLQNLANDKTIEEAFAMIDNRIINSIKTIVNMIITSGRINIDFADIKASLTNAGQTIIATGTATGINAAQECVVNAVENPLFEGSVQGCKNAIIHITASKKAKHGVIKEVTDNLKSMAIVPNINITIGFTQLDELDDEINVAIIATNSVEEFGDDSQKIIEQAKKQDATQDLQIYKQQDSDDSLAQKQTSHQASKKPIDETFSTSSKDLYEDTEALNEDVEDIDEEEDIFGFEK